jgi:acyl-CoA thioester hydrolase
MRIRLPLTVRYVETDAMGIVHHSAYVAWLEAGRVEWLERLGQPYAQIEAQGVFFSVVELQIAYRSPARFGEIVEVETWLSELSSRKLRFNYRVWRKDALLSEGTTVHVSTNRQGQVIRIPEGLFSILAQALS